MEGSQPRLLTSGERYIKSDDNSTVLQPRFAWTPHSTPQKPRTSEGYDRQHRSNIQLLTSISGHRALSTGPFGETLNCTPDHVRQDDMSGNEFAGESAREIIAHRFAAFRAQVTRVRGVHPEQRTYTGHIRKQANALALPVLRKPPSGK